MVQVPFSNQSINENKLFKVSSSRKDRVGSNESFFEFFELRMNKPESFEVSAIHQTLLYRSVCYHTKTWLSTTYPKCQNIMRFIPAFIRVSFTLLLLEIEQDSSLTITLCIYKYRCMIQHWTKHINIPVLIISIFSMQIHIRYCAYILVCFTTILPKYNG